MKWVDVCIKNKLLVYLTAVLISLLGLFCLILIPIAPFPSSSGNQISVELSYPGANAQTVEKQVTSKVVKGLQGINNIQQITATSAPGGADIELTLNPISDLEMLKTQMDIIQAIASSDLPTVVPAARITLDQGTSGLEDFVLVSDTRALLDLENYAQAALVPKLKSLPNVVVNTNSSDPVVKVQLDPEAMMVNQLDPLSVASMLNLLYRSNPLGSIHIQNQEYVLNLLGGITNLKTLENAVVGYRFADPQNKLNNLLGSPVLLNQIAKINFEPRDPVSNHIFKINGKEAVWVSVNTHSNANPFTAQTEVNELLQTLPRDIQAISIWDTAVLMKNSIHEVVLTILVSSVLVLFITLLFLGRLKAAFIPMVTIPLCLLGAMLFLYPLGYSLDLISLLGLVIAVGLVVDDAIVVIENISHYLEKNYKKHEAVLAGTRTISLTIIGITLTLVVAYLPILLSSNMVAEFFKPFVLTLSGAVLISGVAALTLTPVMSYQLIHDGPLSPYQIKFDRVLNKMIAGYQVLLLLALKHKKTCLVLVLILLGVGCYFALQLPKAFFPNDPDGRVNIVLQGTPGDTLSTVENRMVVFKPFEVNEKLLDHYETLIYKDSSSGMITGRINLVLKMDKLKQSPLLANQINDFIKNKNIQNAYAKADNISSSGNQTDLSFFIYGIDDPVKLNQMAAQISDQLSHSPLLSFASAETNSFQKQLGFEVDQAKAARLGISEEAISQLLSVYYGGYTLDNYFNIDGLSVPVVIQLNDQYLENPDSLQLLKIQSPSTNLFYPIDNFVNVKLIASPLMISSFNGQPDIEIDANLAKNYSLAEALPYIDNLMKTEFSTVQYQYTGPALEYLQGNNQTLVIILAGIVGVFFLLALIFKNLFDPLIIMLTVPFAMLGGALSLYLIQGSINLYSSLGLITLVGLITKHGVLIVQFSNQGLKEGKSVLEAVLQATHSRFRPIMMTTFAMTFGALPLVLSSDIFYKSRENLGVTIMGGVLVGTLFSLFIIPLVYSLIKRSEQVFGVV